LHADTYLREAAEIAAGVDRDAIERLAIELNQLRDLRGRLFVVGLGGSFSNAEHCAADLWKLCLIEAQAPNVAEMSAWINDSGRQDAFAGALRWMRPQDALLVLSVGGGTADVSQALVFAIDEFRSVSQKVFAIVGPHGGYAASKADIVVAIPAPETRVTPHTEAFQAVVWHCLVSHPLLQWHKTKW
jgi:D-sedoheptulose 7-phosphate isomerase